jgi:hypothetical protein
MLAALVIAFLAVISPWIVRNQIAFGSPLAPGGIRALWWTEYDDLFAYPAGILTPNRWLETGTAEIIGARLRAAGQNLVSSIAVGGLTFLFPLMAAGFARLRRAPAVQTGAAVWVLLFLLMSLVFPFAGTRGGFFHAAAALQPLFWALVPEGLDAFVAWGSRVRKWHAVQAARVFGIGCIAIAGIVTGYLGLIRIFGPALGSHGSDLSPDYGAETLLVEAGALPDDIVMVNNPPGYALRNDRPAIVIPTGGLAAILGAAEHYEAAFLVLGSGQGLPEIYNDPESQPGLDYLGETAGLHVFRFEAAP